MNSRNIRRLRVVRRSLSPLLLLVAETLSSCQKVQPQDAETTAASAAIAPLICEQDQTPAWFALKHVEWTIYETDPVTHAPKDISREVYKPFYDVPEEWDPTSASTTSNAENYRFDFCATSDGGAVLKRIVHGLKRGSPEVIVVAKEQDQKGFQDLVFGTTKGLHLKLPLASGELLTVHEFLPAESNRESGAAYIMVAVGKSLEDGRLAPRNTIVTVGQTQFDVDPFGKCASFGMPGAYLEQKLELGSAHLRVELCVEGRGGDSFQYSVASVEVTDNNSALGSEAAKTLSFSGAKVKKAWKETLTHHKTCDHAVFQSGLATYGMTAAPWTGADSVEGCNYRAGAPKLPQHATKAHFLITYPNGTKLEGDLANRHYFDESKLDGILH